MPSDAKRSNEIPRLGLLLAPCLPEVFFTHVCFFDAASIYHADAPLKKRSFEALGGFISISKELRALWTPDFANRLWCIFEVAAFRKINPEGRIVIAPLSIEVFVAMLMPVTTAYGITFMFVLAARQTVLVGALASSIAAVPVGYGVHLLRREMQSKKDMLTCLDRFDLDKAALAEWTAYHTHHITSQFTALMCFFSLYDIYIYMVPPGQKKTNVCIFY